MGAAVANIFNRFPSKANSLAHINQFTGHDIRAVIDVGILYSTPELIRAFPHQKHVLIEPVQAFNDTIRENYAGMDFELLNIAMSNSKGKLNLELRNHLPDSAHGRKFGVTASNLVFDGHQKEGVKYVEVETDTLDNVCSRYQGPFLVKIDVDGAEIEILNGADKCLGDVYWIVIESWLSRIGEITRILNGKGFDLWDIVDLAYMRGQLSQVDLVFVNKKLMNNERYKELSPRNFSFQSSGAGNYVAFKEGALEPGLVSLFQDIKKRGSL
jgi:FkbM family methyltransferase